MIRFLILIALLLVEPAFAEPAFAKTRPARSAGGAPTLDIQATCRRAQPLSGGEKSAYQGCLNDETEARKELIKTWSSFRGAAQTTCKQETMIGGAPSYVELLTCLQLDKQAAEASRENAKALKVPASQPAPAVAAPKPK